MTVLKYMYIACLVEYNLSTATSFQNMDCARGCENDFQAEEALSDTDF